MATYKDAGVDIDAGDALVENITGSKPRSLHHDISTVTGEEIVAFTLVELPCYREAKKK